MRTRSWLGGVLILMSAPALPQGTGQQARNAINWEIFQKLYPPRAIAAHEEGDVGFIVTLDSKGDVAACQVTKSSGHPLLDQETCKVLTLNAQFNPDPNVSGSQVRTHQGLIAWRLPDWARSPELTKAGGATQNPIVVTGVPEKVVCKKTVRVGTLAGFERTCMTPTEWAKQSDEAKQAWDEIQGRKGSSRCISLGGADTGSLQVADGKVASNGVAGCE